MDEGAPISPVTLWTKLGHDENALLVAQAATKYGSELAPASEGREPRQIIRRRARQIYTAWRERTKAKGDEAGPEGVTPLPLTSMLSELKDAEPRIATGIKPWDDNTNGGVRSKVLTVLQGPPGAGKTSALLQVARSMAGRGVAVAWVGIDEDPSTLLVRNMQAVGIPSERAEHPDANTCAEAMALLECLPLDFYNGEARVEEVIEAHARRFPEHQRVVVIDSLQHARTADTDELESKREVVDNVVYHLKRLAKLDATKCAVLVTCEVARGNYRNKNQSMNSDALASAKESGGIEYGADQLLEIRNVTGEHDLVSLVVVKARGPQTHRGATFTLKLDRETATYTVADDAANLEGLQKDAAMVALSEHVLTVIDGNPGCSTEFLCESVSGRRASIRSAINGLEIHKRIKNEGRGKTAWRKCE